MEDSVRARGSRRLAREPRGQKLASVVMTEIVRFLYPPRGWYGTSPWSKREPSQNTLLGDRNTLQWFLPQVLTRVTPYPPSIPNVVAAAMYMCAVYDLQVTSLVGALENLPPS